jgi:hypothetical protein
VPTYASPADPTLAGYEPNVPPVYYVGPSCYPANAWAFDGRASLARTFADGTSNTILLAEHYYSCTGTDFGYAVFPGDHRPSFADGGPVAGGKNPDDVYPVTDPAAGVTRPSRPGATFQVAPKLWVYGTPKDGVCDSSLAQTPHPSGMLVALVDGSVRGLSPGIQPETYWAAVTPAGGEVLGADW